MPIEREKIRMWVYDSLRQPPGRLGTSGPAVSLSDIERWVSGKAEADGLLELNPLRTGGSHLERVDEDSIRECIWALIIQGIVVPGNSNHSSYESNLPWLQVTDWGMKCLESGEYVPYETGLFIKRLRTEVPSLDPLINLYLREALNSFRSGNYLAVAVMVGVASERILIVLRDSIRSAIPEDDRKKKLTEATDGRTAKQIHDEITKRIDPIRKQLPDTLEDSIGFQLEAIFHAIRVTRNEAGHPTGRAIERGEAYAQLQLFPIYARCAYALVEWLSTHSI